MTVPLVVITIALSIITGLLGIIGFFMMRSFSQFDDLCKRMDVVEVGLAFLRGQHSINHKEN